MTTNLSRTPKEIADLKASWLADGCWDIEDTEGFEAHREELVAFRREEEAKWEAKQHAYLLQVAEQIGHPGDIEMAQKYENFRLSVKSNIEGAATYLTHYFQMAVPHWHSDNTVEMRDLVEKIVEAAACDAMARSIRKS